MTPDELLGRLERARPSGPDKWSAACPAHEDRVMSLSIGVGDDGRLLLHCHAGCTPREVLNALALDWGDLFPGEYAPAPPRPGHVRIRAPRATYLPPRRPAAPIRPQVDEDDVQRWAARLQGEAGVLARLHELKGWSAPTLARLEIGWDGRRLTLPVRAPGRELLGVLRYLPGGEPKMLATCGASRTLWPAPGLRGRLAADPLLVVEGEPDAVSGHVLGLPTTAVPGAGTWREAWVEALERRTLVVVGDCDSPGRAMAERVRRCLDGRADVRVVDLAPERDDGHDLGDEVAQAARWGELGLRALRRRLLAQAGLRMSRGMKAV
jgi:hypothetical protein